MLFDTPLPQLAFVPVWTPFAHRYLEQGLQKITLYKREGKSLLGDAPDFVSHNRWPAHNFDAVLAKGEIGEGGGWPVEATQGGTFAAHSATPTLGENALVIAFLKLRPGSTVLADRLYDADEGCLFAHTVPGAPRRFDAVLLRPRDRADLQAVADGLIGRLGDSLDRDASRIAAYSHATDLPKPA